MAQGVAAVQVVSVRAEAWGQAAQAAQVLVAAVATILVHTAPCALSDRCSCGSHLSPHYMKQTHKKYGSESIFAFRPVIVLFYSFLFIS